LSGEKRGKNEGSGEGEKRPHNHWEGEKANAIKKNRSVCRKKKKHVGERKRNLTLGKKKKGILGEKWEGRRGKNPFEENFTRSSAEGKNETKKRENRGEGGPVPDSAGKRLRGVWVSNKR